MAQILIIILQAIPSRVSNAMTAALKAVADNTDITQWNCFEWQSYLAANDNIIKAIIISICIASCTIVTPAFAQSITDFSNNTTQSHSYDMQCFQAGKVIVEERNIRSFTFSSETLNAVRNDGAKVSMFGIKGDSGIACYVIDRTKSH